MTASTSKISASQKMVGDAVRMGKRIPYIHSLIELDGSTVRKNIAAHRAANKKPISLNAYLIKACSLAVAAMPDIQRMKTWRNKTVTFSDVDVFAPYEVNQEASNELKHVILRKVNEKSIWEVYDKINQAPLSLELPTAKRVFFKLPWFLRSWFYRYWMAIPKIRKAYFGTVYISSCLQFSKVGPMWGIPLPMHSLGIFIGTLSKRTELINGQPQNKEVIHVTISLDHRIGNGADIGRLAQRLKHILEHTNLLEE